MLPSSPIEQISRTLSDLEKRIERLERLDQVFTINAAETVINEAGIDRNLRIEGDNEPNLVFIDAGIDGVGIGTVPAVRLHLVDDTNPQVTVVSDAGVNNIPTITAFRHITSGVPAIGFGLNFVMQAYDNASVLRSQAQIQTLWTNPATGAADSRLIIFTLNNSVASERIRLQNAQVIVNFANDDVNFIVETTGYANTLFVDGARDNVGIKTSVPNASASLEIAGTDGSILIPRLTTVQRNALAAVNGMGIYNTTTNQFEKYQAGAWVAW